MLPYFVFFLKKKTLSLQKNPMQFSILKLRIRKNFMHSLQLLKSAKICQKVGRIRYENNLKNT